MNDRVAYWVAKASKATSKEACLRFLANARRINEATKGAKK